MQDAFGQEIWVGDEVAFIALGGTRNLRRGTVISIGLKMITVSYRTEEGGEAQHRVYGHNAALAPNQVRDRDFRGPA